MALLIRGPRLILGPGSASRHFMPRRVRDTRETTAPAGPGLAGGFFCDEGVDKDGPVFVCDCSEPMTDRRPLLRAMFDAAVGAAHPGVVLAQHLPPAPKGRV